MDKTIDDIRMLLAIEIAEEIKEIVKDDSPKDIQTYMENEFSKVTQEIMKFGSNLTNETDRGCALISASFLDSQLEKLIKKYLVDDTSVANNIFSNNGSLGTFSSRIDMAYLLGLIGKKMHRDLHIIRKIRNEFGHNPEPISFETQSIQNRCTELYYTNFTSYNHDKSSRSCFINSVCEILANIKGYMVTVKHINSKIDLEVTKEMKETNTKLAKLMLNNALRKVLDKND